MSGMARAAPMMPGSVATFCSCSSERSRWIAASSSSSAKTRAGTRMSARASAGISHSVSSILVSSDIEHDLGPPDIAASGELEAMVRHCLHEVRRASAVAGYGRTKARLVEVESLQPLGDEVLGPRQEDEL